MSGQVKTNMADEGHRNMMLYRSFITGNPVSLDDVRIFSGSSDDVSHLPDYKGDIREADLNIGWEKTAVEKINLFYWGSLEQDIFGRTYNVIECRNYLAVLSQGELVPSEFENHGIAGNMALHPEKDFLHIVVFNVWPEWHGRGVGTKFLETTRKIALETGKNVIKVGTTNDNIPALYFYQRAGFEIEEIVIGEVAQGHGGAPDGFAGIPVRDEIRLRLDLK